jgi:hypothetical protein
MEMSALMQRWIGIPLVCSVLGVTGCSTARPPVAAVAQADQAVRQATESKAPVYAPTELRMAEEKLSDAHGALSADEYTEARRLAEQATADARLAQAKGNAVEAQRNEEDLRKTIDALRAEAARPTIP